MIDGKSMKETVALLGHVLAHDSRTAG
jgi:hypothetical protein